ncbi:hypothetical protein Acy02nite_27890 [Actinoplanes cyaneus]|uniref:Uncharacterized protein n=1 Tax=Actinoplanes cyaneus TaxID=52696 RepID=A0A919IG45_9ACTN|nr:hypothetical protein Acy02nite_27890 [Actinoplanes cyaneus]
MRRDRLGPRDAADDRLGPRDTAPDRLGSRDTVGRRWTGRTARPADPARPMNSRANTPRRSLRPAGAPPRGLADHRRRRGNRLHGAFRTARNQSRSRYRPWKKR